MKLYSIIFLFWIYNIFAIFQFSWMAGVWFDSEDLMQRSDYEIYKPPLWQYQLYYILLGVYVVISSLLLYLWQKKIRNTEGGIIVWVLHIIWVLFFILGWMISIWKIFFILWSCWFLVTLPNIKQLYIRSREIKTWTTHSPHWGTFI